MTDFGLDVKLTRDIIDNLGADKLVKSYQKAFKEQTNLDCTYHHFTFCGDDYNSGFVTLRFFSRPRNNIYIDVPNFSGKIRFAVSFIKNLNTHLSIKNVCVGRDDINLAYIKLDIKDDNN